MSSGVLSEVYNLLKQVKVYGVRIDTTQQKEKEVEAMKHFYLNINLIKNVKNQKRHHSQAH